FGEEIPGMEGLGI
ncbi:hypothetical protein NL108_007408, partial [Boleophthalmus pectinirostris]